MLNILDRPFLDYAVEEAKAAGIETFIFVTNKENTKPVDYFSKNTKSCPKTNKKPSPQTPSLFPNWAPFFGIWPHFHPLPPPILPRISPYTTKDNNKPYYHSLQ